MEALGALLLLLLSLFLLPFGLYCCYLLAVHAKYDHIPGAPRESFFLGHLPIIWRMLKKNELVHDLFLQWAEEYGPIVRLNAFHRVSLLIFSPEGVKEYLMLPQYPKDRTTYSSVAYLFGMRFLGNGLVCDLDYEHWHKQRRIMDPAFSRTYLISLMETFNEKAEELMKKLEEKADGKTEFDIMNMMNRVTLDVIGKVAFGMDLNTLHDDQTPFPHAVSMVLKGTTELRLPFVKWICNINAFDPSLPCCMDYVAKLSRKTITIVNYMPGKQKLIKEIQESVRLLRRTGRECIEHRREVLQNGGEAPRDILTKILQGNAQEETGDDENMLDNFVTFFIAGHETTSNQLSFTIMELGRQPEILERLRAEVDEIIGAKRDIDYEDLGKLHYLSQVLKESLRLYPPVPGILRWTGKEDVIEGVRIPANTTLILSTYVMGRLEKFFKDPLTFNPDRFSEDVPKPYFSYFPFALGPRSCIGQVFSQMEAKVVMAKLLQRFEFQLVPGQTFRIVNKGTSRPKDGVVCRLKPRIITMGSQN